LTRLRHFMSWFSNYFWREKNLGCSYGIWGGLGDCFVSHTQTLKVVGEYNRNKICSLEFCWVVNHRFSCFSFWISTLYITNVWYVQFWVKKIVKYWWRNNEYNLKLLCFLNETWILITIFIIIKDNTNFGK